MRKTRYEGETSPHKIRVEFQHARGTGGHENVYPETVFFTVTAATGGMDRFIKEMQEAGGFMLGPDLIRGLMVRMWIPYHNVLTITDETQKPASDGPWPVHQ